MGEENDVLTVLDGGADKVREVLVVDGSEESVVIEVAPVCFFGVVGHSCLEMVAVEEMEDVVDAHLEEAMGDTRDTVLEEVS